jgi:hypothetical protein
MVGLSAPNRWGYGIRLIVSMLSQVMPVMHEA